VLDTRRCHTTVLLEDWIGGIATEHGRVERWGQGGRGEDVVGPSDEACVIGIGASAVGRLVTNFGERMWQFVRGGECRKPPGRRGWL